LESGCLSLFYSNQGGWVWGGSGTDNNGNVLLVQHVVPNNDQISSYQWMNQYYSFDSLNPINSVTEQQNGATNTGAQYYTYDRFGNRTINQASTWGNGIPKPNFGVDPNNTNCLTAPAGYTLQYDAAGYLTYDNYSGEGTRTYDAENRMKQAWANNQWQTYTYDADGHRVKRLVNGNETWQVYGMNGELLAEYLPGAAPFLPTKEYGYRDGELLVTMSSGDDLRLLKFLHKLYIGALGRSPNSTEQQQGMDSLTTASVTDP
jgi:YD repeat-containing protein